MNTHDKIELPEPAFVAGTKIGTTVGFFCKDSRIKKGDGAYTREQVISAIEADRKLHDRMLAHEWIRPSLGLDEDAPYRFDFYAQEIEKLKAELKKFGRNENDQRNDNDNRERRGEPVAWAAFDDNGNIRIWTAKKGEAKRLSEQVGQTLRPLYAAPQPLSESDIPAESVSRDVEALVRLLEDGEWAEHVARTPLGQRLELAITTLVGEASKPHNEPVRKTDWNNELSSWSDEDFIRIFHEHPDLANRLRKMLAEPVKKAPPLQPPPGTQPRQYRESFGFLVPVTKPSVEPVKVDTKASVPSDNALDDALSNLEHDNYEQSYSGYKNRQADIALIRTALARYK